MTGLVIIWMLGTVVTFFIGLVTYVDAKGTAPRRTGARIMFASPAWFFIGAIIAAREFRAAWRAADWKRLK